ncbi:hypothetical protein [Paenarthrobacter nitroguajacolicus]|uniref:hypothetical protein n=1 Tax=Paenarthrobacter nitroguajacolicus TaxID=211146 RepID=UPI00248CD3DB|nr:hypothetical protein [Paenarthrobacter nitroguajacolicus]MDI2033519.1 hypothetical protein [Paenarthrobacter nitroguajacolicus]
MIIQSGFDFQVLARPYILPNGVLLPRLVVVGLDSDMCFRSAGIASFQFDGWQEPLIDDILEVLPADGTRYFAIAYPGFWRTHNFESAQPSAADVESLRERAGERGLYLLGHFGIGEEHEMQVNLESYFDQSEMVVPRTMLHWRHSVLPNCP